MVLNRDIGDIACDMENRHVGMILGRKLKKLESFQLSKPSDLSHLYLVPHLPKSAKFAGIAATEVGRTDNMRKIQGRRFNR